MGWDYYTYQSQPTFFIQAIKDMLLDEQKERLKALKEQQKEIRIHGR